jgi:predicted dehydrogenase
MANADYVRIGVIGLGNIGKYHAEYLQDGKVSRCKLTAVADANTAVLKNYPLVKTYGSGEEIITSGDVDAVIIATPHFQHTTLGILAMDNGIHAMVEKPISSHKADAERLFAAHARSPKTVFAGMFQLRLEPRYQKIRNMIRAGEMGDIVRINWINTDWFRTQAYYNSSDWRATWKGEGGGVLLNQCLHNLDVLQWMVGQPSKIRGFCQLGRFHDIEVEDNVTAYMHWQNGATGAFISSTGEAPGTNRLEIVGSRGTLVLENGKMTFARNEQDMIEFARTSKQGFSKPGVWNIEIPFANAVMPHTEMVQNFVDAILDGVPLIAPGEDGLNSVELSNSMVYSSILDRTIDLPMDSAAWEAKLNELIANSKVQKKVASISTEDFVASFRK